MQCCSMNNQLTNFPSLLICDNTYHVKAMSALAYYDRTVIARELAFATGSFEVYAADTAGVIGLFGEIPFPGGDGFERVDGDFHDGGRGGCGK
jgi:hypothetical protein